jgi:hypothetical protein
VCANALSRHHGTDVAASNIAERTIGLIFLGTPFEGSSKAKWGSQALRILDLVSTTQKENTKDLEERSAWLVSINDAFHKFLKTRDRSESRQYVEVACFFEQYGMYIAGKISAPVLSLTAFIIGLFQYDSQLLAPQMGRLTSKAPLERYEHGCDTGAVPIA